ncbi:DUF4331 family protein, partial [Catenulispora sp. NF23]|uniref:DUF4331 family protein n=1 Tax=Catenulispora pinistramenti TaxID=2705254 RepID=UPI001BA446FE
MSHHLSAPNLRYPRDDARLDLTDTFVFPAAEPGRTVFIQDSHPYAPSDSTGFHPDAVYRINVDTNGDAVADVAFSFVFSPTDDGGQTFTLYRAVGADAAAHEAAGEVLARDVPVSLDGSSRYTEADGYRVFAGLRSDPFFIDLEGIVNNFQFTGKDAFGNANVHGIALEVPDETLGTEKVGVWSRISLKEDGTLRSVERGAHPSVIAFLVPDEIKEAYNAGEPADDRANYLQTFIAELAHTGKYEPQAAETTLATIVPDILAYDRTDPVAYPNGRALTDDCISARLAMVSNGAIPGDGLTPHPDLLPAFPYL